ncbi:uncharacterized protein BDZ99DRAFT_434414 [Mytilinidion resinicola]|uniref:Integral membrane protein n=1 Tax=Mytilinidion resinicola TaxID=574789 RepID=A0A6A6Z338_9PEZI|nr:uncharacterized protein BDZ99DRAFT_434414 [Mytilinidion resinicola]KAF2814657.1 hypothetical protein BDZ99DRAFT_434414 [Mytilinidion resinicola]
MDRLKSAAKTTRDKLTPTRREDEPSGSLTVPHANAFAHDGTSTIGVNEGIIGPRPAIAVEDFAAAPSSQSPRSPINVHKPLPTSPDVIDAAVRKTASNPSSSAQDPSKLTVPTRESSLPEPIQKLYNKRPRAGSRQPSIGIRRLPSAQSIGRVNTQGAGQNVNTLRPAASVPRMSTVDEASSARTGSEDPKRVEEGSNLWARIRHGVESRLGRKSGGNGKGPASTISSNDYDASMVDVLDTVDPEVATLTSLTNVQNSLFIPQLGKWINRRPTYNLRPRPNQMDEIDEFDEEVAGAVGEAERREKWRRDAPSLQRLETDTQTIATIDSRLSDSRFAVLPEGRDLRGWSIEDKKELNDHVRHMLHSKRSRFKRQMRGFGQYIRRPLGFLVTLYAFLITVFGLAWVLFLIGWINVGGRQIYLVNVIDNIMVALFAVVGDGLAPFRAVDTYHMAFIAHYHHLTWKRRDHEMLPELRDHNDLPATNAPVKPHEADVEQAPWEFTMLTPKQQAKLEHHQTKFSNSHTFYKPHETETHFAFPLRLLVAVVVLLDCHSLFQIALGACTWGIYYKRRPFALTTVILCCSITCNATAGLLILIGDKRTRKNDVLERMNRQELTEEAMDIIIEKKEKEREEESDLDTQPGHSKHGSGVGLMDNIRSPTDVDKRASGAGLIEKLRIPTEGEKRGSGAGLMEKLRSPTDGEKRGSGAGLKDRIGLKR